MEHTATLSEAVVAEIRAEMGRQQRSARALAEQLGVSHIYLSRRFTGKVPLTLADVDRIAVALGVPASQFMPARPVASAA